jgi:hypothetical protein
MTVAPPLSSLRITKLVLFRRLLIAIRSSLLMLILGGLEFRRITTQSCLIRSLSFHDLLRVHAVVGVFLLTD